MPLFMITVIGKIFQMPLSWTAAIELPVLYFLFWLRKKLWEKKNRREGVGHGVTAGHRFPSGTATCHFRASFISVEFNYKENRCLGLKKVDLLFLKL